MTAYSVTDKFIQLADRKQVFADALMKARAQQTPLLLPGRAFEVDPLPPVYSHTQGSPRGTITNAVLIPPNHPAIAHYGYPVEIPDLKPEGDPLFNLYLGYHPFSTPFLMRYELRVLGDGPIAYEFILDGDRFEAWVRGSGPSIRMRTNGKISGMNPLVTLPSDGDWHYLKFVYATRGTRRILIEGPVNFDFGGVYIPPDATVWKAQHESPNVIHVGDSFTEGTGTEQYNSLAVVCNEALGWNFPYISGQGASGYLNPGIAVPAENFAQRIPRDVAPYNPDIVVFTGGLNDYLVVGVPSGGITVPDPTQSAAHRAAIRSSFQSILTINPNCLIIATGPMVPKGSSNDDVMMIELRNNIKNVCLEFGTRAIFIDNVAERWITGEGKSDAPAGDGNADFYRDPGGTHPTPIGHGYIGVRLANAIHIKLRERAVA